MSKHGFEAGGTAAMLQKTKDQAFQPTEAT
jgi:hypothetical protein